MAGWFKRRGAIPPHGPDFSTIDSEAKVEELYRRGELEKLILMPVELGGQDEPDNVLYVPIGVASIKSRIDQNIIAPLAREGKISRYQAEPEYQGGSFVPIALKITASDPGHFTTTIQIWGQALGRSGD